MNKSILKKEHYMNWTTIPFHGYTCSNCGRLMSECTCGFTR